MVKPHYGTGFGFEVTGRIPFNIPLKYMEYYEFLYDYLQP